LTDGGTIFNLVQGKLVEMNAGPYVSEDALQKYLEEHPKLLAGEQIDPESPRRWLLIAREMSVPDKLDGKERWALDHLFVDQDAIPTLVEVKRGTNTEIRRQIVGQLLDYAANGSEYWTIGKIRESFAATCARRNCLEKDVLTEFLAPDGLLNPSNTNFMEEFWSQIQQNMDLGRIRLLFVADIIPVELRRVIEFLNLQMSPAHVMGVEIRQFIGDDITAFVPHAFPQSVLKQQKAKTNTNPPALDSIQKLISSRILPLGAALRFEPNRGNSQEVTEWLSSDPDIRKATWDPSDIWKPLRWEKDGLSYSATGLAKNH